MILLDKLLIIFSTIGITIFVAFALIMNWSTQISLLIGVIPATSGLIKIIKQRSELKIVRKQTLVSIIKPVVNSLVRLLEKQKISIEVKDGFIKKTENFLKKDNITETVVLSCFEFAKILKIPNQYKRGYALALSHSLSNEYALEEGLSAQKIDNSVRKRGTIPYGDENELETFETDWYKRFCESHKILDGSFEDLLKEVESLEISKIDEKQIIVDRNYYSLSKFFKSREAKIDKLVQLVIKNIPEVNFNKILSTLRTEVVTISSEGFKDASDGTTKRGSDYLNQAFNEKLPSGSAKLNRSVRFVLLDEMAKGRDIRSFDVKKWGKEIDDRAKQLRSADRGDKRVFSFVVLKSSINELHFFGDDLPEKGMIKMTPEILDGLKPEETTKSTLQIIARALGEQKISLQNFIDHNLEYLDGIPDQETANKIIAEIKESRHISKLKISDFPRYNIQKEELTKIGILEEQANSIISEAKMLSKLLKLY